MGSGSPLLIRARIISASGLVLLPSLLTFPRFMLFSFLWANESLLDVPVSERSKLISDFLLTEDFERPTLVLVLLNRHDHSQMVVANFASTMRPRNQVMLLIRQRAVKLSFWRR